MLRLQKKPNDPDVFRLLGEVKYELGDYEGSATAYKSSATVSILIYGFLQVFQHDYCCKLPPHLLLIHTLYLCNSALGFADNICAAYASVLNWA